MFKKREQTLTQNKSRDAGIIIFNAI